MSNAQRRYRIRLRWQAAALLDMSGAKIVDRSPARYVYEVDGEHLLRLLDETHTKGGFGAKRSESLHHTDVVRMRETFHHLRRVLHIGSFELAEVGNA
jgi:hypothetical protein